MDIPNDGYDKLFGISETILFTTGIFSGMVYSQVWNVGEATLLGALMVAPFGYSLGMVASIVVFRPFHGRVRCPSGRGWATADRGIA